MFPKQLIELIGSFLQRFELLPWVNPEKLHFPSLHDNPNALDFLEERRDQILWWKLCENKNAIYLIEKHLDCLTCLDWIFLSANPAAIHLLRLHQDKICWVSLSGNPAALDLLRANFDNIDWRLLSTNPNAIDLLEANPEKIVWESLSLNKAALHLLEENLTLVDWEKLSRNPGAVPLLAKNLERINWKSLAYNESAISLMQANPEEAFWNNSATREAVEYLTAHKDEIAWNEHSHFFANPFAMEFFEKLSRTRYLGNTHYKLGFSRNPAIFRLCIPKEVLVTLRAHFSLGGANERI